MVMSWTHMKRMRALFIAFMFVVVVVATVSWLVHSLLVQVVLGDGTQQVRKIFFFLEGWSRFKLKVVDLACKVLQPVGVCICAY